MVECTNLTKCYKKKRVVDNLSFKVNKFEIFAFLGTKEKSNAIRAFS